MTAPGNEPPAEQVATPSVSTAPTSGTAEPPHTSWWHWKRLPHHLGRARTSTVILSVLFLGHRQEGAGPAGAGLQGADRHQGAPRHRPHLPPRALPGVHAGERPRGRLAQDRGPRGA